MPTDTERLQLSIEANLKQYERELARAQKTTVSALRKIERDAQQNMKRVESTFARFGKGLAAGFASALGGISLGALAQKVRSIVGDVAKIADDAKRSGLDPETLQAIAFAGRQAGVETEKITSLMQKFNLEIGEAATKGGDLAKILAANGVEIKDGNGEIKDTKTLFYDVTNLIKNAKSQQEASVVAMAAFGKQASDALPFLQQGAQAIQEGEGAARRTGGVISNELVAKADEFDDKWTAIWDIWTAKGKASVIEIGKETEGILGQIDKLIARAGITSGDLRGGGLLPGLNEVQIGDAESMFPSLRENPEAVRNAQAALNVELAKQAELEQTINQLKTDGRPQIEIDEYIARLEIVNERLSEAQKRLNQFASTLPTGYSNEGLHAAPGATGGPGLPTVIPDLGGGSSRGKRRTTSTGPKNRTLDAFQRQIAEIVEITKAYELAAQAIGLTAGETEKLETRFDLLNAAQKANVKITPEVSALIEQMAQRAGDAAQKVEDLQKQQDRINEVGSEARAAFVGFFSDLANGTKPIDALTAALDRLEQKLLDLILNSAFDALFGKAGLFASAFSSGSSAASDSAFAVGKVYHSGGIVGRGNGPSRMLPASVWHGAPRFHGGGLAGNELPAILKPGEGVFTPQQMRALGRGGGTNIGVKVVNNAGVDVQTRKSREPGFNLEIVLEKKIKSMVAQGKLDPEMARYGSMPIRRRV